MTTAIQPHLLLPFIQNKTINLKIGAFRLAQTRFKTQGR